jgi:hypothetical protein
VQIGPLSWRPLDLLPTESVLSYAQTAPDTAGRGSTGFGIRISQAYGRGGSVPDSASSIVSTTTRLSEGNSQVIAFRPGQAGVVTVSSVPSPNHPHSETGLLAVVQLRRPGSTKPVARAKFPVSTSSILVTYPATAADLATTGDWTCEVFNASLDPITFATDVTFPISNPLATASIDTVFLNLILAKIFDAAALQLHLESSGDGDPRSSVSLSPDIATLTHLPTFTPFTVPDQLDTILGIPVVYRILNLDSDREYPIVILVTDPLSLKAVLQFDTTSAKLVAQDLPAPDINLDLFTIEVTVGFDGSFHPVCSAIAHATFNDIDVSDDIASGVQDGITKLSGENPTFAAFLDKKQIRAQIDATFAAIMRLGPLAQIQAYGVDGQTVTVTYFERTAEETGP